MDPSARARTQNPASLSLCALRHRDAGVLLRLRPRRHRTLARDLQDLRPPWRPSSLELRLLPRATTRQRRVALLLPVRGRTAVRTHTGAHDCGGRRDDDVLYALHRPRHPSTVRETHQPGGQGLRRHRPVGATFARRPGRRTGGGRTRSCDSDSSSSPRSSISKSMRVRGWPRIRGCAPAVSIACVGGRDEGDGLTGPCALTCAVHRRSAGWTFWARFFARRRSRCSTRNQCRTAGSGGERRTPRWSIWNPGDRCGG
ncbi:hypothetical protein OH76DRAFT_1205832 [Lentinus brumalis]|uniref:Uncharacterized protein n=1 Tax=Lentinus brumalis TaxID=2498619 RepID=A0A371CSS6_9APHY|nr:hypothetical protein OH76DRAFT_1205832 [Polyporus brumalis]